MRIAIYQPRYFPQLHYFNRLGSVDTFVILDSAQYTKALTQKDHGEQKREKSYQSDTPIRLPHGTMLLTVPILHNGYSAINETHIDYDQRWATKHLTYLKTAYGKTEYFPDIFPQAKDLLNYPFESLAALNITTTLWALAYLLDTPLPFIDCTVETINEILSTKSIRLKKVFLSKNIQVPRPEGLHQGTQWTVEICEKIGATEYMYGKTAKENYMDEKYYKDHGIRTIMQQWKCDMYPQPFQKSSSFIPNLSILDLLFTTPTEEARDILGMDRYV